MQCLQVQDKKKVEAEEPVFGLASVDLVEVDAPTWHIAEHLPSIRYSSIHPYIHPSIHSLPCSVLCFVLHAFICSFVHSFGQPFVLC